MLSHEQLSELYRSSLDRKVLSVYIDGDQHDPAERKKWRRQVEELVGRLRKEIDENGDDSTDFERAWTRLDDELSDFGAFLPARGWVGFATGDGVPYAAQVPVPMPDLVRWEDGIRVAPYIRALKQNRPVVTVLVDSQKARVFEYRDGEIEEIEDLRADTYIGDLTDVNVSKRSSTSTGVRGETGTDQAQRILDTSSDRMLKALLEYVADEAGDEGYVVLGGTPEMVRRAAEAAPKKLEGRLLEAASMHLDMSAAEVREAADRAASTLTERRQEELLESVIDQARSGGRACLGRDDTEEALREMRVDTLLLSRNFIRNHPDFADRCAGTAFAQSALIEELGADAGGHLDREGEGIGARLRYTIRDEDEGEADAA